MENEGNVSGDRDRDRAGLPEQMRRDVRLLGDILGEVIRDSVGPDLLADVERLRHAVIEARRDARAEAADPAGDAIAALVASWDLDRAEQVARAFTVYFHLANLAEEHQRIRQLRERDTGDEPVRESLAAAVAELDRDAGHDHVRELLESLRVHLVLTAHPTEARRRAVVEGLRRISDLLRLVDDQRAGAAEHAEARRGLRENIDLLWRTSQLRVKAMDPIDEVRTVMAAFDETLFLVVPVVYRELDRALAASEDHAEQAPAFLRYGSWVGADRDGNPFVTAQVTRETATIQADHVLRALENATTRIGRSLTMHEATTPPSAELRRALAHAAASYPELLAGLTARSPQEPYRTYLLYAAARIRATRLRDADLAYHGPAEFLADLRVAQRSLADAGAAQQAYGEVQNLIWQAETFGFHLADLEVRQHSQVHARALRELRAAGRRAWRPPGTGPRKPRRCWPPSGPSAGSRTASASTRAGATSVSFTRSADDMATVYELARYAAGDGRVPVLDVVPLFESAVDLANAPAVLTGMLEFPEVAERLAATGRRLEAMLGYSDSAKELGPASATLRLYETQARLAEWAAAHGVRLTLFHGRGGALGRGGGPAGQAVLAQAPGSVSGSFKVTEQGEVIFARYGQQAIAKRHLEQVSYAVLLASSAGRGDRITAAAASYRTVADRIDRGGLRRVPRAGRVRRVRRLVRLDQPAGRDRRPADRLPAGQAGLGGGPPVAMDLDDLRAIPWVFAWSQTRMNLPGWFGLGSGLAAVAADPDGLEVLRRAYREWPLFGSMLDNAEMSLAKTDRPIAVRYLALGGRDDLTALVLAEYDLTRRLVLAVTGHDRLLADRQVLSRAVRCAIRTWTRCPTCSCGPSPRSRPDAADADRERLERLLLLTVNGVAAGLQNTGWTPLAPAMGGTA